MNRDDVAFLSPTNHRRSLYQAGPSRVAQHLAIVSNPQRIRAIRTAWHGGSQALRRDQSTRHSLPGYRSRPAGRTCREASGISSWRRRKHTSSGILTCWPRHRPRTCSTIPRFSPGAARVCDGRISSGRGEAPCRTGSGSGVTDSCTSRRVGSPMITSPSRASCCSRAATLAGSPTTSVLSALTMTSPLLIPMRSPTSTNAVVLLARSDRNASHVLTPARTARMASSSATLNRKSSTAVVLMASRRNPRSPDRQSSRGSRCRTTARARQCHAVLTLR